MVLGGAVRRPREAAMGLDPGPDYEKNPRWIAKKDGKDVQQPYDCRVSGDASCDLFGWVSARSSDASLTMLYESSHGVVNHRTARSHVVWAVGRDKEEMETGCIADDVQTSRCFSLRSMPSALARSLATPTLPTAHHQTVLREARCVLGNEDRSRQQRKFWK